MLNIVLHDFLFIDLLSRKQFEYYRKVFSGVISLNLINRMNKVSDTRS